MTVTEHWCTDFIGRHAQGERPLEVRASADGLEALVLSFPRSE